MNKHSKIFKYTYYIFPLSKFGVSIMIEMIILTPNFESGKNILLTINLLLFWILTSFFIVKYLYPKFIIKISQCIQYNIISYLSTTTFISQDCSGSALYQSLNLKYLSPFIDILFDNTTFNNILKDIKYHLSQDITFIPRKNALTLKKSNEHIINDYPIFQLGTPNMEIHWIHSDSEEDVLNKWNRRKERINYEKIITINAPKEYKNKFFRDIQISDGEIRITKNNKEHIFIIRKHFPNESNWDYRIYAITIISNSIKILFLLI